MSRQNTLSRQTAKLIAMMAQCMPDLDGDTMQEWIENPNGLKKVLREALCPPIKVGRMKSKHIIDCNAPPSVSDGWTIEEHRQGGQLEWNPEKIQLYLSEIQKTGCISGTELRKELTSKPVLNACVLDYLLANPHLIPKEWKRNIIFFWGTVYRNRRGGLYVRYLYWNGGKWGCSGSLLGGGWDSGDPAACSQY